MRVLAGLLAAPDRESLEVLESMAPELDWIGDSLQELRALPLDAWQGEHTRLFINGFPTTPCIPIASVWLHGTIQGQTAEAVNHLYQQAGLQSKTEIPDYLETLLEAFDYLSVPGKLPEHDRLMLLETLWQDYLVSWVPRFASALVREAGLHIYRRLGDRMLILVGGAVDG